MQWAPKPFQAAAHALAWHGVGIPFRHDPPARRWLCVSRERGLGIGESREARGSGCSLRQWNNITSKSLDFDREIARDFLSFERRKLIN